MSDNGQASDRVLPIAALIARTLHEQSKNNRRADDAASASGAAPAAAALGPVLKSSLSAARASALAASTKGEVVAKRISASIDTALTALYDEGVQLFPGAAQGVTLCAVGGFGRGRLAPYSDIDLLLLHRFKDENAIRPFLDFLLYPLWDAGLTVGHHVHRPSTALDYARDDMVTRTAFLDARRIAGDRSVFDEFKTGFDRLRQTTKSAFVAAKLAELEDRHDRSDQSRYLAEPDVKDGKGGLRDLDLIRWLYRYVFDQEIDAGNGAHHVLSTDELKSFAKAERFLWSIRMALHAFHDTANETLTFEAQPVLADRLGYAARSGGAPAERMMRHYFVNAVEVGRLLRLFCAKLEEERTKRVPRIPKRLPRDLARDEAPGRPNLRIKNGRIDFQDAGAATDEPRDFFRLFRAFSKRPDIDFSPDALALISANAAKVTTAVRRDPVNAALFMATVMETHQPMKTLRVMHEVGLLAKFLPFFGKIAGQVEYGLYRRFTLDEQIFQAVGVLSAMRRGETDAEHPFATRIVAHADNPAALYALVLLYEARFSLSDPGAVERTEKLVRRVGKRLGVSGKTLEDIAWIAARHDIMATLAERRSLSHKRVIDIFADKIKTQQRLDLLMVLSVCHLRVVGAHSWDRWSRQQLSDLYRATSAVLSHGDVGFEGWLGDRAQDARATAAALLEDWSSAERRTHLDSIPARMVRALGAGQLAQLARLARAANEKNEAVACDYYIKDKFLEVLIYADDRPGLLADLAGAIARCGVSVRSVQVLTWPRDAAGAVKAVDVFTLQSVDGGPLNDQMLARQIVSELIKAASAPASPPLTLPRRIGDRRAIFDVEPAVRMDLDASDDCVVVEAEGRDRPGLLQGLTSALSEIGVTIQSAYIATYGERVVDTFYLQDAPGYKITNHRRLQSIERRLLNVLMADR